MDTSSDSKTATELISSFPDCFGPAEFCTPIGAAVAYKKLIVDCAKSRPILGCRCTIDSGSLAESCGTAEQWAAIVEKYLEAERKNVPVKDDLESRLVLGTVPSDDLRVALRGQRGVFTAKDQKICFDDKLECIVFLFDVKMLTCLMLTCYSACNAVRRCGLFTFSRKSRVWRSST